MEYNSKTFIYFGLFLTDEDKNKLQTYFDSHFRSDAGVLKIYLDHLTLLFKSDVNTEKGKHIIDFIKNIKAGERHELEVIGFGMSDKAFAFKIKKDSFLEEYCMNDIPHITYATRFDGKPVDSNKISNWVPLDRTIKINPIFKCFTR